MSCWDSRTPHQILRWSEFDPEIPRLRHPGAVRPPKTRPVLNVCTAGRVGPDAKREREHRHGGEPEVLQQVTEGEFESAHNFAAADLRRRWTMTKSERSPKPGIPTRRQPPVAFDIRISDFFGHSSFVIRHSYLSASIGSTLAARQAGQCHSALGPAQGESA